MAERKRVLVLGDNSVDWYVIKARKREAPVPCWHDPGGDVAARPGGAQLLRHLVSQCLGCTVIPECDESANVIAMNVGGMTDAAVSQTMTLCSLFPQEMQSGEWVIRIERLYGFRPSETVRPLPLDSARNGAPHAVVIDDAALGIRTQAADVAELISGLPAYEPAKTPWIILKVAWPILDNPLLAELVRRWGSRLVVIAPINDLRRDSVQVSRGLSWERTAQDLSWEYCYNPRMKILADAHCFAVPVGLSGVWLSRPCVYTAAPTGSATASTLVYDPSASEGDWEKDRPGVLLGYTSCLTLGILHSLLFDVEPDLVRGSRCGLSMMRALHTGGYRVDSQRRSVELPIDRMRAAIESATDFPAVSVPLGYRHYSVPAGVGTAARPASNWSILKADAASSLRLLDLAMGIVRYGTVKTLGAIPFARFGGLFTVDRDEIEGFRSIRNLILEYRDNVALHRPLSIAVFGPPGSGKSFGVAQVAESVAGEQIDKVTFNVSQFTDHDNLVDAFHVVRDKGLKGKLPLVFWDEFDSPLNGTPLAWLKAFLAPMQDGEFTQGQVNHPIGRAIFVFAGGTATCVDKLGSPLSPDAYRDAKVPDFKSRLRGAINMIGVDRMGGERDGTTGNTPSDPQYVVRRAIILRSIIERVRPDVIRDGRANIDDGLLKALLTVWSFRHGVRSLESIIELCHSGDVGVLHRSSLPPRDVLALHVDTTEFLGLVTADIEFRGQTLETIAEAYHEVYRSKSPNAPLAAKSYRDLSDDDKERNRNAVRGLPHKLASIGFIYELRHQGDARSSDALYDSEAEQLARLDHDRWIVEKIDCGYVYGASRDDSSFPRKHPDLVPWDEMTVDVLSNCYPKHIALKLGSGPLENPVDVEMAKQIPDIMDAAGYKVTRLR